METSANEACNKIEAWNQVKHKPTPRQPRTAQEFADMLGIDVSKVRIATLGEIQKDIPPGATVITNTPAQSPLSQPLADWVALSKITPTESPAPDVEPSNVHKI